MTAYYFSLKNRISGYCWGCPARVLPDGVNQSYTAGPWVAWDMLSYPMVSDWESATICEPKSSVRFSAQTYTTLSPSCRLPKASEPLLEKGRKQLIGYSIWTKTFLIWKLQKFPTSTLFRCHQCFSEYHCKHFCLHLSLTDGHRATGWEPLCPKQKLQSSFMSE